MLLRRSLACSALRIASIFARRSRSAAWSCWPRVPAVFAADDSGPPTRTGGSCEDCGRSDRRDRREPGCAPGHAGRPLDLGPRSARCAGAAATRRSGTRDRRRGGGLWRDDPDAGRPGDPAARGAHRRRRGRRRPRGGRAPSWVARRSAGAARRPSTTPSGFDGAGTRSCATRRWRRVPDPRRLAGAAHAAGAGGAGPRRAGAEGHRARGVARLAVPRPALRRAGARPGRGAAARPAASPPDARTGRAGAVLGLAPRRRRPVPVPDRRHRRRRGRPARGAGRRPPADAATAAAVAARHRRLDRGRGRRSALSATRTPCRSATSTSRSASATRWSANGSTTTRCSSCSSPTAATATGCAAGRAVRHRAPRAAARASPAATTAPCRSRRVRDSLTTAVSGAGGRRRGRAAGGPARGPRRARRRRHPSAPSRRAGRARARTTSRQNIVLLTHAEPRPSTASATSKFCTPGAHRDEEHLALRRRRAARPGRRACRRHQARHDEQSARRAARRRAGAPRDLLLGEAVAAQVGDPGGEHRVEQPLAPLRSSTTTKRHGVVWCGAGAVTAAATARRTASGSTGSSVKDAHGAPGRRRPRGCRGGTCPRAAGRTSAAAPGPSSRRVRCARPRTTATGPAAELALHQVGGRRDLVGDRGDRGVEHVAVPVVAAAQVVERREPGHPDRLVDQPGAPRAAQRVGDDDRHVDPGER